MHSHIGHLLRKTGAASRAEATALAVRDGLLRPPPDHPTGICKRSESRATGAGLTETERSDAFRILQSRIHSLRGDNEGA